MKNLLYKELKLVMHPMVLFFCIFGLMLLIPSYPYELGFLYTLVSFTFIFIGGRENNDMFYTCTLPVKKEDVVKARYLSICAIELLTVLFAIPCALLSHGNAEMLDANFTLFGIAFILYALFNYIFMTSFYKTAKKLLAPFLVGTIVVGVLTVVFEVCIIAIPGAKGIFDGKDTATLLYRAIVLLVGIVMYSGLTYLSYRKSVKSFNKIDI